MPSEMFGQPTANGKDRKTRNSHQADHAPKKAMPPLPPEYFLELRHGHALIDELVFSGLLVFRELGLPRTF